LRVLTVISAIFLPLTLLAGIYGMNFQHMPELDDPYSYYVILGLMFVIALGMLLFFYRRGWFK
jgi:magnesium transporter